MIVYHGTPTKEIYNEIMKNGIRVSKRGTYGRGIYCSSDINLAAEYSRVAECFREGQEYFAVPIELVDEDIVILQYSELANICDQECNVNVKFNDAKPIQEAEKYSAKENIKVLMIKYEDTDEVVIYDVTAIKRIG